MNVGNLLTKAARTYPNGIAFEYRGEKLSYQEFNARVNALSFSLGQLGLKKRDRVAMISYNCHQLIESLYACFKHGFIAVPINVNLSPREFDYILDHSDAKAVICNLDDTASVASATNGTRGHKRNMISVSNSLEGLLDYEKLIEEGKTDEPIVGPHAEDVAWLFYTSGTTGRPKGAMLTHANLISMITNFMGDIYSPTEDDIALHQAPLTHGSGLYSLPMTARGGTNVISHSRSFDVRFLLQTIQERRVTILPFLTPTMIKKILLDSKNSEYDLGSLRCVVYGGSPMYQEDLKAALARFGRILVQIYGQAEAPMTISYLPSEWHVQERDGARTLNSAGIPRTKVRVKIIDESGIEQPPRAMGEIVVEGDVVMKGYWKDPEATRETLENDWLHTGDIGYMDEGGFLYIMDRKKDLIKSGGANIYPREVEEVILQHPAVKEVCVFGVPDPVWGESVKAIVAPREGMKASESEIIEFCKLRLASYKKPKSVEFVDSIPKNANGKVLKRELRDKYWTGFDRRV